MGEIKKWCSYSDGDEDCNKCGKHGYIFSCAGCEDCDDGSPKVPVENPQKDCYDKCRPSEMDKLEEYLKEHAIIYRRNHRSFIPAVQLDHDQIIVYENRGGHEERKWDAICHKGSYGYEKGLLEIMGDIVNEEKDGDRVVGHLTAADVIKRIEGRR